jgi:hypothetical protein
VSKPPKSRSRTRLTAAQLKAYEARRASEVNHDATPAVPVASATGAASPRRVFVLSRSEEMAIIRSDLKRLVLILVILLVVLIAMSLFLR